MEKRSLHFDLLRILACLMVVFMHSPIPKTNWNGIVLSGLSYITSPCIGIFFMLSGALLINEKRAIEFNTFYFLKKRFIKIASPIVFFYLLAYVLNKIDVDNDEKYILWFMYVLSGLYLLTPILIQWFSSAKKNEVELYLFIWFISLLYPYLKTFYDINDSDNSWIYYFHGYVGYFLLGAYLNKWTLSSLHFLLFLFFFIIFSVLLPFFNIILKLNLDFYSCFSYLSSSVMLQCIAWWFIIKKISYFINVPISSISIISKNTFGIYLIHIIVMRSFLWRFEWMQSMEGVLQIVICSVLTFVMSLLISMFISKWKYSKYIIGI